MKGGKSMEDREIINLYWQRNANAINETALKYGSYCKSIAKNILGCNEDADECVNDTYMNAWNSIPPSRPNRLSTYLGKITRNLSFDRYRYKQADKRGGSQIELVLEELGECVSGTDNIADELDRKELIRAINDFLNTLPQDKCSIFLCRYWYALSGSEIARRFGMTTSNVSVTLNRIRGKLKTYLTERGYDV